MTFLNVEKRGVMVTVHLRLRYCCCLSPSRSKKVVLVESFTFSGYRQITDQLELSYGGAMRRRPSRACEGVVGDGELDEARVSCAE